MEWESEEDSGSGLSVLPPEMASNACNLPPEQFFKLAENSDYQPLPPSSLSEEKSMMSVTEL